MKFRSEPCDLFIQLKLATNIQGVHIKLNCLVIMEDETEVIDPVSDSFRILAAVSRVSWYKHNLNITRNSALGVEETTTQTINWEILHLRGSLRGEF